MTLPPWFLNSFISLIHIAILSFKVMMIRTEQSYLLEKFNHLAQTLLIKCT